MKRSQGFLALVLLTLLVASASLAQDENTEGAERSIGKGEAHAKVFVWKGIVGRGYLGVQFVPMTPELRRHFGVGEDAGVLVSRIEASSPAEAAGVLVGDILTGVDGEPVTGPDLYRLIGRKKEGDVVSLQLSRNGVPLTVDVTIAERDRRSMDLARFMAPMPDVGIPDDAFYFSDPDLKLDPESMEAVEDAMRALSDRKGELREKLKRLQELDLGEIQKRMKEVEERLQKLERELDEGGVKKE